MIYPKPFQELIAHFAKLPSIGPRLAERLVMHLFKQGISDRNSFGEAIMALNTLQTCTRCHNIAQEQECVICKDKNRNTKVICVVEDALDIIPIERTKIYNGLYHVLGGVMETRPKNQNTLTINALLNRVKNESPKEIILATNLTTEGDITALYLQQKISQYPNTTTTRLGRGMPTGSDIEYADETTLSAALMNRGNMK
ncbi:MAG: recombination protein RecR [Candidatus Moranbacteria bacterium]|nr:recombination protein RecR [Candidatus Moranbacteria bacterium]